MSRILEQSLQAAHQLYNAGKITEAVNVCRKSAKRFSKTIEPYLLLAEIEQSRGRTDAAIYAVEQACKRAPNNTSLIVKLGDIFFAAGQYNKASKLYKQAVTLQPLEVVWRIRLAGALQETPSGLDEAISIFRAVLEKNTTDASAHYNLGTSLKRKHDFLGAKNAYLEAVKIAPQDVSFRYSLCNLLVELEEFEDAIDEIQALIELDASIQELYEWLYYANKKLLRPQESLIAAEQFLAISGVTATTLGALASAQIAARRYDEAVINCNRALEKDPKNRRLLADKTIALSALDQKLPAQHLFDLKNLLYVNTIKVPPGFTDIQHFNQAVMEHVVSHPTLSFSGLSHSCHNGSTSDEVFTEPYGPIQYLKQAIEHAVNEYRLSICTDALNPWLSNLPSQDRLNMSGWVTRLKSQGYQQGHIHPTAWISGVYYLAVPAGESDQCSGCIEFGRAPFYYPDSDQGEVKVVNPNPGTLVLFPSFFYHRTIPFDSDQERWSLAFDFRMPDLS